MALGGRGSDGRQCGEFGPIAEGREHPAAAFRLVLGGRYEPQKIFEQRKDRTEVMLQEWSSDPTVLGSGAEGGAGGEGGVGRGSESG